MFGLVFRNVSDITPLIISYLTENNSGYKYIKILCIKSASVLIVTYIRGTTKPTSHCAEVQFAGKIETGLPVCDSHTAAY